MNCNLIFLVNQSRYNWGYCHIFLIPMRRTYYTKFKTRQRSRSLSCELSKCTRIVYSPSLKVHQHKEFIWNWRFDLTNFANQFNNLNVLKKVHWISSNIGLYKFIWAPTYLSCPMLFKTKSLVLKTWCIWDNF
jgi:hypothetical protein